MNRILLFFCLLFGLYSCHTPSTPKTPPANIVSEFRITSTQVGAIRKGMTIKELYAALPEDRIKKLKTRTELSNETADYYYIYGDSSRLLLIVNTERQNDERSRISRIIVKDKRFQTTSGIGLASTVGTIRTAYPHSHPICPGNRCQFRNKQTTPPSFTSHRLDRRDRPRQYTRPNQSNRPVYLLGLQY